MDKLRKPSQDFAFPTRILGGENRKFNFQWLQKFPWLAYSKLLDDAFCLSCVLFRSQGVLNGSELDRLMQSPLVNWSNACSQMTDHEQKSEVHKVSMLRMNEFKKAMENKMIPVYRALNVALKSHTESKRAKLVPIIKTVLFCGRQNVPLCGHRDDSAHYGNSDCRNFQTLLDFRVDSGDQILQKYFDTAPHDTTCCSKIIQKELITCEGEVITDEIIDEIKHSKFYAVMADEVQDCSNKEQMLSVVRYVDRNSKIQEKFIKFVLCDTDLTGEALSGKVKNCIADIGLDLKDCRGQCYDGARNMAGKCSGAVARILENNQLALYTHCASHRLNLCVAASCSLQNVRSIMDNVRVI